ncbi:membrane-bound lytic murein transglycosylase MltC [Paraferrimonas sedimenticola]|uniref:Membrane-bound lytic murein transglycosylase C n=1 Tax=Paraferrimonas sedimenticola TaxID=375674 RepID=A0AA37RVS8_9GAMM|nr:membrane-bound lytic murein transglycosylase MltC [Paraferrimonas sedimenticola]GLP96231.1 membrane-bound lytic murein transglycosylase C [Paraferrimonas sedimenticola]
MEFIKRLTPLLFIPLLASCTATEQQRLLDAVAKGKVENEVKSIIKDKEQVYKSNPEQLISDVKSIKELLDQLNQRVESVWGKKRTELPDNKRYVKYTNDYKARAIVDFEKGTLRVETIDTKTPKSMLQQAIVTTLLATANPKDTDIFSSDAPKPNGKPFLYRQVLDQNKKPIQYQWRANRFADYLVANQMKREKLDALLASYVEVPLVSEHLHLRKQEYSEYVLASAKKYDIAPSLIYGVIETESSFNPFAVSHANAYGLMQVVPSTAGRDVYEKIKNRSGQPTKEVLFDPKQNIDIGTAYLNILTNRYLSKVVDPTSRHFSIISAYNGGAGNVLNTFSRDRNQAFVKINRLSSEQVYRELTTSHPRAESRRYLYKVHKAEKKYQ